MNATITYSLSETGRKASILAGGDGKPVQSITIAPDAPEFREVVLAASMTDAGPVLKLSGWEQTQWDIIPTVGELLARLARQQQEKAAEEAAKKEEVYQNTLCALTERRTTKHNDGYIVREDGAEGRTTVQYETAHWPYDCDQSIKESPEAVAWVESLHAAEVAARAEAEVRARSALAEKKDEAAEAIERKRIAAEAESLRRAEKGLHPDDVELDIEDGALIECPVYTTHKRGRNWMAIISVSPSSPGGLARQFCDKAKGDSYYMLPCLSPGDPIEFGADYYSGSGRKDPTRWHGFVVQVEQDEDGQDCCLILRKVAGGKSACKEGTKFAKAIKE